MRCIILAVGLFVIVIGCGRSPESVDVLHEPVVIPSRTAANDGSLGTTQPADLQVSSEKPRTDNDPVAASMSVSQRGLRPGDTFEVSVVLDIAPGYEIYPQDAPPPGVATRLELQLPSGFSALGDWTKPAVMRSAMSDGHPAHAGEARFTRKLRVESDAEPGEYRLICSIRYQACTAKYCLRPTECEVLAVVSVGR